MQRTTRLGTKLIAGVTAMMFAGTACTQSSTEGTTSEAREVTVEVWTQVADESGVRQLESVGSSKLGLDEITFDRAVIIGGLEKTTNLMKIPSGSTFVVPLNTGETATVLRTADGVELVSFTGPQQGTAELPRGAVKSVRLLADGFELFMKDSKSTTADTVIELQGLEKLGVERDHVVGALALQSLLMSLEDTEQLSPPVAIALIAAAVAWVWFATCGSFVTYCAYKCWAWPNQETQCAGLTVKSGNSGLDITLGGGYSCRCTW
ncbi:MAG: hypothetical protein M4D80_27735 [Myxococcota bacterium]|nr:hypothetical protein [Myxococcota bacterium]